MAVRMVKQPVPTLLADHKIYVAPFDRIDFPHRLQVVRGGVLTAESIEPKPTAGVTAATRNARIGTALMSRSYRKAIWNMSSWRSHSTAKLALDAYAHWMSSDADRAAEERVNQSARHELGTSVANARANHGDRDGAARR